MRIFPAIDLREGKAVRLTQGDFARMKVYSESPAETARSFLDAGAKCLHVVDLDGARTGLPVNDQAIREILAMGRLYTEVSGGIRDEARIIELLALGADRVILGTAAAENFPFARRMIEKYGPRIAVGVDARDNKVAVRGWEKTSAEDAFAFCQKLCDTGVGAIIYTDITRDGALQGTNLEAYRALRALLSCELVASGGISSLDEITALREMGVDGAILGKAIYAGVLDLRAVLELY